jgi:HAD superfamily hydrolase (TIGR01549 family)
MEKMTKMILKAVFFDLNGTLAYVENPVGTEAISKFLLEKGYEVYPQSLGVASHFVGMIDYPKHGYNSWQAYLKQVLHRLDVEIDTKTLQELAMLYQQHNTYTLFSDTVSAITKAKQLNLKIAIVTTIASFMFYPAIAPIRQYFNTIMTGYKAGCEKSNPKMLKQTLKELNVTSQEAVMVGDDPFVDIKIPKKLGMHTILLDRANKIRSKPHEADAKTTTLVEAVAIIEKWQKERLHTE